MKKQLYVILIALMSFTSSVMGAESLLKLGLDTQWLHGVHRFKVAAVDSSSDLLRLYLGGEYRFSKIAKLMVRWPVVYHIYQAKYNVPGASDASFVSADWYSERLRVGVEGKLFPKTILGQISWFTMGYLPTMRGYNSAEHHFYNHSAVKVGFKNLFSFARARGFITGTSAYTFKFKKEFLAETRKYGDEISSSWGIGYFVTPHFSPAVQVQYSYVFPMQKKIGDLKQDSDKGASAVHVVPSLTFPLSTRVSLFTNTRVLLYRDKREKQDASFLWGNFEDEGDLSVQLGIRLGIL